jgi:nucleotide-binding universal stress UspA family protein
MIGPMPGPNRPSSIVVGFDGSDGAFDAVALGRTLADLTGDDLVVVAVSVADMSLQAELAGMNLEAGLRGDAEQVLARGAKPLEGSDAWVGQALVASSPGLGLHALAERESAELIVVGASHRRHPAGVPGSTAMRLLHGAPCSVAVAASGWSRATDTRLGRIGVGFDGSDEAKLALSSAAELARRSQAELHAFAVLAKPAPANPMFAVTTHGYEEIVAAMRDQLQRELDDAVSSLAGEVTVEAEVVDGDPAGVLAERSRTLDVLFVGSRGYGPVRTALAGSVSSRVAAESACSVIVVPRGVKRAFPTGGTIEPASHAHS